VVEQPVVEQQAADAKQQANNTPILIYVPGLGASTNNTADEVAEAIRSSLDPQRAETYKIVDAAGVPSPTGLKVSKSIVAADDAKVLQFFEFDYGTSLSPQTSGAVPAVVPGAVKSSVFVLRGFLMLWPALTRPAKTLKAKFQLALGIVACAALVFVAVGALVALLAALGVNMPGWLDGVFGEEVADWRWALPALGVTVTWAAFRKALLGIAAAVQACIRFIENDKVVADSISEQLNQALDGLGPSGWKGPVHLLGYSFGSLVLFETMFPRTRALRGYPPPTKISSLVTIGCPLDVVRLFKPNYVADREARDPALGWTNVFNEADIFASNLTDHDDKSQGAGSVTIGAVTPVSVRYTDQEIGILQILASGKTHSGYWAKGRANCFGNLVPTLVPPAPAE
jgi:hypothetical protein